MLSHRTVLHARAGHTEKLEACLRGVVESMQGLPGCQGAELRQLPDDAAQWVLHSRWQSVTALQVFFAAPWLQQLLDQVLREGCLRSLHCESPEQQNAPVP